MPDFAHWNLRFEYAAMAGAAFSCAPGRPQDCGWTLLVRDQQNVRAALCEADKSMSCADNLLAELPFLLGPESAAETKTSIRVAPSNARRPQPVLATRSRGTDKQVGLRSRAERADSGEVTWRAGLRARDQLD